MAPRQAAVGAPAAKTGQGEIGDGVDHLHLAMSVQKAHLIVHKDARGVRQRAGVEVGGYENFHGSFAFSPICTTAKIMPVKNQRKLFSKSAVRLRLI